MPGAIDPRHYPPRQPRRALNEPLRGSPRSGLRAVPELDPRARFGPQYAEITRLIEAVEHVTVEQSQVIEREWYQHRGRRRFAARSAASSVAAKSDRLICQIDARQMAWSSSDLPCRDAAGDAAHALAVRDLAGPIFSQGDYDELVGPWVSVMDPLHPDDVQPA